MRILRHDALALLALALLAFDLAVCRWRPLGETIIMIALCGAALGWRWADWRGFFARGVPATGTITGVREEPRIRLGAGVAFLRRAVVSFAYEHEGKRYAGSFDDRPERWPEATRAGGPITLIIDPLHPEHAEPRSTWLD